MKLGSSSPLANTFKYQAPEEHENFKLILPFLGVWKVYFSQCNIGLIFSDSSLPRFKISNNPIMNMQSVFIPIPKKGNPKECSNYCTIALISHAFKVMLKILQARLQQYVNHELPDVQAGFRKGTGTRDQIANIQWIIKKAREFQKKHLFLHY